MKSIAPLAVALTVSVFVLSGCGQERKSAPSAPSGDKPVVGLVMKSLGNQYFQDMQAGAVKHSNERGDLKLEPVGTQSETDIDGQVQEIDKFISEKVRAIVIAPADSRGLVAPIKRAVDAGIKIINIDVKLDDGALKQAGIDVPFVGPDNRAGAKMSGDVVGKALGPSAKVVILEGNPGADNAAQRKNGFMDVVAEHQLTLLDSKTAHWETDEANAVFTSMLTSHPDVQGVFSSNDSMTLGVVKAVQAAHKTGQIQIASFDNIPAVQPLVKDGTVTATLDQFGSQQAAMGIDFAMKELSGQNVSGWQKTDIKLITKNSLQ
jgi:ribose transport system substrate-binding protein